MKSTLYASDKRPNKERLRYVVSYNARARRWFLTRKGEASAEFRTQREAIKAGVERARANKPSEIIIKAKDGKIRDNRTYGADPRSTRG